MTTAAVANPLQGTFSADDVADWMYAEFQRDGQLVQANAAIEIKQRFGEEHLYTNNNGNWAIKKPILDKFKAKTPSDAVWSKHYKYWRKREPTDPLDKRIVY